jgi:hypothetical protein
MRGQTMTFCEGLVYNPDTRRYEEACGGVKHYLVAYPHDVLRYLRGLPITD